MVRYAVQLATRYDGLVIASFPDLPGVSGARAATTRRRWPRRGAALDATLKAYAAEGDGAARARGARRDDDRGRR